MYKYLIGRDVETWAGALITYEPGGVRVFTRQDGASIYRGYGRVTVAHPLEGLTIHDNNGACIFHFPPFTKSVTTYGKWRHEWASIISQAFRGAIWMPYHNHRDMAAMKYFCESVNA